MARHDIPQQPAQDASKGRGTTRIDQETERALAADEVDETEALRASRSADRDMHSGGKRSTGSTPSQSEGTDQGSSSKGSSQE